MYVGPGFTPETGILETTLNGYLHYTETFCPKISPDVILSDCNQYLIESLATTS